MGIEASFFDKVGQIVISNVTPGLDTIGPVLISPELFLLPLMDNLISRAAATSSLNCRFVCKPPAFLWSCQRFCTVKSNSQVTIDQYHFFLKLKLSNGSNFDQTYQHHTSCCCSDEQCWAEVLQSSCHPDLPS